MTREQFIVTKEHRRFTEFADTVKRQHTIGICYGPAGIGKTLSARRYSNWDKAHTLIEEWGRREDSDALVYAALAKSRTVLYTPSVMLTPRMLKDELDEVFLRVSLSIEEHLKSIGKSPKKGAFPIVELIIVDESERLSPTAVALLRDRYDRNKVSLILIGMPGLEKQFSRYPQFYSRVGFAHQYRPLAQDELNFVLQRHWRHLGETLDLEDFTDAQAIAAIARVTRGNFRLLERLFSQIERVMKINDLTVITDDAIEVAQSTLVIGVS